MVEGLDLIELRGLRVTAVVGVLPEERERAQPLELDLDVAVDLRAAGRTDDLGDTVDYGALCTVVTEIVAGAEPLLLERLATLVAEGALAADDRVRAVDVVVRKLRPPVPHDLASSGVRVRRTVTS
jgi:dihydroneopterin aldolase